MTKVIFLNGPPRSGKDTVAEILHERLGAKKLKFADPLKRACHALFGLEVPNEYFDSMKDKEVPSFRGRTPRSVYIAMSESHVKKTYGKDFFGYSLLSSIRQSTTRETDLFVVSDSGFVEEGQVVAEAIGPENCLLIHLHRQGCSFSNDSRDYITLPKVDSVTLHNDLNIKMLETSVLSMVNSWLKEKK